MKKVHVILQILMVMLLLTGCDTRWERARGAIVEYDRLVAEFPQDQEASHARHTIEDFITKTGCYTEIANAADEASQFGRHELAARLKKERESFITYEVRTPGEVIWQPKGPINEDEAEWAAFLNCKIGNRESVFGARKGNHRQTAEEACNWLFGDDSVHYIEMLHGRQTTGNGAIVFAGHLFLGPLKMESEEGTVFGKVYGSAKEDFAIVGLRYHLVVPTDGSWIQVGGYGHAMNAALWVTTYARTANVLLSGTLIPQDAGWIEICPGVEIRNGKLLLEKNKISATEGTQVRRRK